MNHLHPVNTTIINIFGGPGAGKSTAAALLFARMRMKGISCEYIPEFAKELSRANDMESIENQFYVSAIQYHRQYRLLGKVDYIVTDSPVLTGIVYDQLNLKGFREILADIQNRSSSINILLIRDESKEYETEGRHHTGFEAEQLDGDIEKLLQKYNVSYYEFYASDMQLLPDYIFNLLDGE
jgi:thymidylate kinase